MVLSKNRKLENINQLIKENEQFLEEDTEKYMISIEENVNKFSGTEQIAYAYYLISRIINQFDKKSMKTLKKLIRTN